MDSYGLAGSGEGRTVHHVIVLCNQTRPVLVSKWQPTHPALWDHQKTTRVCVIYTYIYICICVYIYIYIYIFIHTYTCVTFCPKTSPKPAIFARRRQCQFYVCGFDSLLLFLDVVVCVSVCVIVLLLFHGIDSAGNIKKLQLPRPDLPNYCDANWLRGRSGGAVRS